MASASVCRLKIVLDSVNISSNETAQTAAIATQAATFILNNFALNPSDTS